MIVKRSRFLLLISNLPFDDLAQRTRVAVSVRYRPMIALQHDRIGRRFGVLHRRPRWPIHFDVLLNGKPIMQHANELRILRLLACRIEARRAEPDVERLPFAWTPRGVAARRGTTHALVVDPAMRDRAAIRS